MDVEEARVTGRAERLNAQAAPFLTGRTNDAAERLFHGGLVSRARMKTSKDEQLHASSFPHTLRDAALPGGPEGSGGDGHEPSALVDEPPAPELGEELVLLEHALVDAPA